MAETAGRVVVGGTDCVMGVSVTTIVTGGVMGLVATVSVLVEVMMVEAAEERNGLEVGICVLSL